MSATVVSSRSNASVRRARAVRDGKERGFIFIEGVRLCEEATDAALDIETVFHTEQVEEDGRASALLSSLAATGARLLAVTPDVLDFISDTKTAQGVVALALRPRADEASFAPLGGAPLVVVLHRLNNPSNAGAILRAAEAAGANGVISTRGTTDLLSPKSLRGSMGSAFRLPLWVGAEFDEALRWCAARGVATVATAADAPLKHTELDWTRPRAVVVGPEASGLSQAELAATDERVRVPMRPRVESLNAAVALGVILYEAARQRGFR